MRANPSKNSPQVHKRSKWAIESRLARMGKIPEPPSQVPGTQRNGKYRNSVESRTGTQDAGLSEEQVLSRFY